MMGLPLGLAPQPRTSTLGMALNQARKRLGVGVGKSLWFKSRVWSYYHKRTIGLSQAPKLLLFSLAVALEGTLAETYFTRFMEAKMLPMNGLTVDCPALSSEGRTV